MSLETLIEALTAALNANTAAIQGNVSIQGAAPLGNQAAPAQTTPLNGAANVTAAPVQSAAVTPSQAAGAPSAAGYPSNQPAAAAAAQAGQQPLQQQQQQQPQQQQQQPQQQAGMTLEQLQQEVTAIYHQRNSDPQVMQIVQAYAPSLTDVPPAQYGNLINQLRALP